MSDMLRTFVERELKRQIQKKYPHLQRPTGVYAKVTAVNPGSVNLKILDKNKTVDKRYPEIPFVKTDLELHRDEVVVVLLLYGECIPYIIGRT